MIDNFHLHFILELCHHFNQDITGYVIIYNISFGLLDKSLKHAIDKHTVTAKNSDFNEGPQEVKKKKWLTPGWNFLIQFSVFLTPQTDPHTYSGKAYSGQSRNIQDQLLLVSKNSRKLEKIINKNRFWNVFYF